MKVQCPGCNAKYNLDISKLPEVPEKGIAVTCPKCKHKFPLVIKKEETKTGETRKSQDILSSPKCLGCGKVFTKEEMTRLKISIGG